VKEAAVDIELDRKKRAHEGANDTVSAQWSKAITAADVRGVEMCVNHTCAAAQRVHRRVGQPRPSLCFCIMFTP
jgi:hypothetical protein